MSGVEAAHRVRTSAGTSIPEVLLVVSLAVTLTGMAVPALLTGLDESRVRAAAAYLAARIRLARMEAVKRSVHIGIRFEPEAATYRYTWYVDGNGNGIRTADIRRMIDRQHGAPERIEDQFPGVTFGIAPGVTPVEPGDDVAPGGDPIRLGRSDILALSPAGTATSGTLYVRSREGRQYAVRVLGVTGRTRVLEFRFGESQWITR